MPLALDQIQKLWETPKYKDILDVAAEDNERMSFHAKLSTSRKDSNDYVDVLLNRIGRVLNNAEKYARCEELLEFPLVSNSIISKGSDEWNKIFYSKDGVREYYFNDEKYNADFEAFLDKIDFNSIIQQGVFNKAKQSINTIAIIDAPAIDPSKTIDTEADLDILTEPYVYFIDITSVKDIGVNFSGEITYLLFETGSEKTGDHKLIVIDEQFYRVYEIKDGAPNWNPISESIHPLGYCPATFIWRDTIDPDNPIRRFNAVLESVEKLDKFVVWTIFKEYADLYSSFPILWNITDKCEYEEGEDRCNGGIIYSTEYEPKPCPACNGSNDMGPGHMFKITVPEGDGSKLGGEPAGYINSDRELLDYNTEKLDKLEVHLIKHMTGVDNDTTDNQALNESQIRSTYETRQAVLAYWAENIQYVDYFIVTSLAKLRYQAAFISATVNYGVDFFLYDEQTATKSYEEAKSANLPAHMVEERRKVIKDVMGKSNPTLRSRLDILEQLEPYLNSALSILEKGTLEYELKANFSYYINMFERENTSVVKFAQGLDFNTKINAIQTKLYEYVNERRSLWEPRQQAGVSSAIAMA